MGNDLINGTPVTNTEPKHWQYNTMLQVRDGEIVIYPLTNAWESRTEESKLKQLNRIAATPRYSGKMTVGARKRLVKAATRMFQGYKPVWKINPDTKNKFLYKGGFLTLTMPDSAGKLSACEGHHLLLYPFLRWLTRTAGAGTYIWKVELTKKGTLHYHLLLVKFIHYKLIREQWNKLLRSAGLLDEYNKKYGNWTPPSTEIKTIKAKKKIAKYICKELGKDIDANILKEKKDLADQFRKKQITESDYRQRLSELDISSLHTRGKLWDCSSDLLGDYFQVLLTPAMSKYITACMKKGMYTLTAEDTFFRIINLNGHDPPLELELLLQFESYCYNIRNPETEKSFRGLFLSRLN